MNTGSKGLKTEKILPRLLDANAINSIGNRVACMHKRKLLVEHMGQLSYTGIIVDNCDVPHTLPSMPLCCNDVNKNA